jgi:lysophospholipid acyltransferase (LPLAT)-like uncharacterized protein
MNLNKLANLWLNIEGTVLAYYHLLLAHTLRWQIEGQANITLARASERPILWVFWHEQLSCFVAYGLHFTHGRDYCIIRLGGDDRGDILHTFAVRLQVTPYAVDMDGNPMAAGRAVLRVIQAMKRGMMSFLAPDGPGGPVFEPKQGVAYLARKAEAAVIPVGGFTRFGHHMKRWDKYLIPFPFGRLVMVFGQPIMADKKDDDADLLARISASMTAVYDQARTMSEQ